MISGFHHSVNEVCILLGIYTAQNGSFLPMFQENLSLPPSRLTFDCLTIEGGSDTLSRNAAKKLPFYAT
jgi:hypothetical protein